MKMVITALAASISCFVSASIFAQGPRAGELPGLAEQAQQIRENLRENLLAIIQGGGCPTTFFPKLEGEYLGNFVYQTFDAETNMLSQPMESYDRPITVYRNPNYDAFIAYEFDENGVSNTGAFNSCSNTAIIKADLPFSSIETWRVIDDGETIESTFIYQRAPGEPPVTWMGTFWKVPE